MPYWCCPPRFQLLRLALVLWSVAVAFSRVYLGVHYPFDVLAGALLGSTCAWVAFAVIRSCWPRVFAYVHEIPTT
ncbi:phosphatase PAP2 family protein [Hymenobacter sp. YC55]|uniref:phosphatase PAP2 family protein n=1 Tax=Hymenobacter sp. YC55 TaxID=3034019 RepID=UPI0023F883CC|nr:phosphatase PAP2 family protein [Hymenobacter sp. YC55]MDF7815407.1 phosphatase PAP2 family protein [Hymenobacter sp. YC55]